jgi:hypothetical protein
VFYFPDAFFHVLFSMRTQGEVRIRWNAFHAKPCDQKASIVVLCMLTAYVTNESA